MIGIIIAADWDGSFEVQSWKAIEKAKASLQDKGNDIKVCLPVKNPEGSDNKLDFNDLLTSGGVASIQSLIQRQVPGLITPSLSPRENQLDEQRENQSDPENEILSTLPSNKEVTDRDQHGQPTAPTENQKKILEKDHQVSPEEELKQNILAYFEQELSKPENRNWTKEHVLEDVQKDPLDALNWWQKDCGGGAFDPSKPLSEQPTNLQPDNPLDDTSKTPEDDFVKDFAKELKNLDDSIERVTNQPDYQGALANYTQQRDDLLKGVNGTKMEGLKSQDPDLAHRIEEHQNQQVQTRGAVLGI